MCEEYNGWTNRETWATALWLDNDEGTQEEVKAIIKAKNNVYAQADTIKEFVEELFDMENLLSAPEGIRKHLLLMLTDIGSIYRVDWKEIAESYSM